MDGAVFKLYAVGDTLHIILADVAVAPYVIDFFLHEFRMCELRGKVAVVGEKKHAGGVAVEAAYRVDTLGACTLDEIHHRHAAVGVVARCHAVFRFVEQDIALAFGCNHLLIVFYYIVVRDLCAELCHYLAVDLYQTLLDIFIGLAA